MPKDLILVLDAGTSGVKCSVFNERCELIASRRADYATIFPHPGWAEQDMDEVFLSARRGIKLLLEEISPEDIACVGLSGTMNGCVPVDRDGAALRPNIIHSDSRAAGQLEKIRSLISPGDFYKLTGNRLDNHYTLPKILWMMEYESDLYDRTRYFLNTKDYIYWRLTGVTGVTDYSDASLTIAMDIGRGIWAYELLKDLGIDAKKMPVIKCGHDVSHGVSAQAAKLTGLKQGTPVALGGGDGACAARGSGLCEPGSAYACLGSSSWISQLTSAPVIDPKARIFNYLDMDGKSCHCCGTIQCGGDALNWAVKNLLGDHVTVEDAERLARDVPAGAEGVFFLPTLMGERTPYWDPNTRGVLWGFSLYHGRAHIARAVYEGVAFALNSCAEAMNDMSIPVRTLTLTGGGARSGLWPQMLASLIGAPVSRHAQPGEGTSLGAAIAAGVGMGWFTYKEAAGLIRLGQTFEPIEEWAKTYREIYPVYADIYTRMKPLFDRAARLQA